VFAFDLYDCDSSGVLCANEVSHMLQDIYGKKESKSNFNAISVTKEIKAIESNGELLSLKQFGVFAKTHQALLFPAFQMQMALRRRCLGVKFWEKQAKKRMHFSDGKYISVGHFIISVSLSELNI
jgi:hypothetical protein